MYPYIYVPLFRRFAPYPVPFARSEHLRGVCERDYRVGRLSKFILVLGVSVYIGVAMVLGFVHLFAVNNNLLCVIYQEKFGYLACT